MYLKDALQNVLLECEEALERIDRTREHKLIRGAPRDPPPRSTLAEERASYAFGGFLLRGLHRRID